MSGSLIAPFLVTPAVTLVAVAYLSTSPDLSEPERGKSAFWTYSRKAQGKGKESCILLKPAFMVQK
jgi:hypothetical protein